MFRIAAEAQDFVLKLDAHAHGRAIAKERWLMELLSAQGIPVPAVERCEVDASRLGWPFLVTRDAGRQTVFDAIRQPGPTKYALFQQMGAIQATLHQIEFSSDGDLQADGILPHEPDTYWKALHAWSAHLVETGLLEPDEARAFQSLELPPVGGKRLCHSDYHAVQCVVSDTRISAIVDWESAWSGNPAIDLAITRAYLDFYAPPELTKHFWEAYHQIQPIPVDFERAYLPVRMGQTLGVLRAWNQRGRNAWQWALESQRVARVLDLFRRYLQQSRNL